MTPEECRRDLRWAQRDPVGWWDHILGFKPWSMQARVVESVRDNRRTAVRSSHAVGKSTLAAATCVWFLMAHPRSVVISTATTSRQVKGILWREIHALARKAKVPLGGELSETKLKLADDWWAWGFTADEYDPTSLQGFHAPHILVVVDEAAGVAPGIFEGLESAMSGGHPRMLLIGNPTQPDGDFARAFDDGSAFNRFTIDAFDTPNFTANDITIEDVRSGAWQAKTKSLPLPQLISPEWVAEKWRSWCGSNVAGEKDPRWMSRVRAQLPTSAENALFPDEWVDAAMKRHTEVQWEDLRRPDVVIGADVARLGKDTTQAAFHVPGYGVREVCELPRSDTYDTAETLSVLAGREVEADRIVTEVRIDADGLGAGVYDAFLRTDHGHLAVEVKNGVRAHAPDRYVNARSEMLWTLRELIDPNGEHRIALPPDEQLRVDLRAFRWNEDRVNRIAVESKDDIKARIGRSPDRADAVAYAVSGLIVEVGSKKIVVV